MMASRMKLEGRGSAGEFTATSLDEGELVALILLLFYMCYGAVRTMRAATARLDLRQEDLPVVPAARGGTARRGLPVSAGGDCALGATAIVVDDGYAVDLWRECHCFPRHGDGGGRYDLWRPRVECPYRAPGRECWAVNHWRPMVATTGERLYSWRLAAFRLQHVVPVEFGEAGGIGIRSLDVSLRLSPLRFVGQPCEP